MKERRTNESADILAGRYPFITAAHRGLGARPDGAAAPSLGRLSPPAGLAAADDEGEGAAALADDFVTIVRESIETLSCGNDYPTIQVTAEFVGLSVRTLQRRLARAGTSHHVLVAQARFATAAAVLERTDAKILELALDLGYSDHANFTRAFRRWAGCAPREFRSKSGRREGADGDLPPDADGSGKAMPS